MTAHTPIATTAAEYAARYHEAYENNALVQSAWHTERDGRQLACALGVIGDEVDSPADCPAQIMPRWLAQMVPGFFDRQREGDAFLWGLAFTDELARLNGQVPFSVVHDWHANTVCPLGMEVAEKLGRGPAPHKALQALHLRALGGEKIAADEWRPVLKDAYADADAYANAYAYAATNADAYADAYAYAYAATNAYADAYAAADAAAHAAVSSAAHADAYADAYADAWKRLADGMTEALKRVQVTA